ncbi:transposase [Mycobacterium sp. BMJ-28]
MHTASRGTYGARRVHSELTLGLGLQVGHNQVRVPPCVQQRAMWACISMRATTGCGTLG